jgi:hypothetical protein
MVLYSSSLLVPLSQITLKFGREIGDLGFLDPSICHGVVLYMFNIDEASEY